MRPGLVLLLLVSILAFACGDSNDDEPSPATNGPSGTPASRSTPPATGGQVVEVAGIVGSVDVGARTIRINRLSGAPVDRITLGPGAAVRAAGGAPIALGQVRVSDRIVAAGRIDTSGALVAEEITVSGVVSDSPGG